MTSLASLWQSLVTQARATASRSAGRSTAVGMAVARLAASFHAKPRRCHARRAGFRVARARIRGHVIQFGCGPGALGSGASAANRITCPHNSSRLANKITARAGHAPLEGTVGRGEALPPHIAFLVLPLVALPAGPDDQFDVAGATGAFAADGRTRCRSRVRPGRSDLRSSPWSKPQRSPRRTSPGCRPGHRPRHTTAGPSSSRKRDPFWSPST